jgi:pimeloyl-ACP methyl ester carboxylesterase
MRPDEYKALKQVVSTSHGKFTYLDVGEGPPVLFVHGLFMSSFFWHRVIDEISDERRCIAYNLPFHSGSEVAEDQELTLSANVEMLAGFCDALELDSFDVVANDTGGALAQGLAVRDPDRLRTLTLTNCEARDWMPSKDDLAQLVATLARDGNLAPALKAAYDDLDAARQGPFAAPYQWPDRIGNDELRAILEPHHASVEAARQVERFVDSLAPEQLVALEPGLRELQVPTLLVWGTADPIFPLELAHWLMETLPRCDELIEIDQGKLFWPFERGDELVPHLRRRWAKAAAA